MVVKRKTLEELEQLEMELLEQDEAKDGYYAELISVYKQMYRQLNALRRDQPDDYEYTYQYVKKQLIASYIKYGTYMKIGLEKNPSLAKSALKKALKYDENNPVAHYRLGFLAYQAGQYFEALQSFQAAINNQSCYANKEFVLNDTQLYYAQLYSINSALYIAQQTQQALQKLNNHPKQLTYESSHLLGLIEKNEEQIVQHAFYYISRDGKKTCSIEECNELVDEEWPEPTLVLYFADRVTICKYGDKETSLSFDRADMLRHLLLVCSEVNPGTRNMFTSYFTISKREEVASNTFRQKIGRLKADLRKIGLGDVIQQTMVNNEAAYYIEPTVPYIVLYRVDDLVAANMHFEV